MILGKAPPNLKYWASWRVNTTIIDSSGLPWFCYTYRQTHCRPLFHLPADWRPTGNPAPTTTVIKIKKKHKNGPKQPGHNDGFNNVAEYDDYSNDWDDATTLAGDSNKKNVRPASEDSSTGTTLSSNQQKTKRPNDKFTGQGNAVENLDTTTESLGSGPRGRGKGPLKSESPRSFDTDEAIVPTTLRPEEEDLESGSKLPFAFFTTAKSNDIESKDQSDSSLVDSGRSYSTVLVQTPRPADSRDLDEDKETTVVGIVTPIGKFDPVNGSLSTTTNQPEISGSGTSRSFPSTIKIEGESSEEQPIDGKQNGQSLDKA